MCNIMRLVMISRSSKNHYQYQSSSSKHTFLNIIEAVCFKKRAKKQKKRNLYFGWDLQGHSQKTHTKQNRLHFQNFRTPKTRCSHTCFQVETEIGFIINKWTVRRKHPENTASSNRTPCVRNHRAYYYILLLGLIAATQKRLNH